MNEKQYKKNAQGHLIPIEMIKPVDLMRDQLVGELIALAKIHADAIARFKASAFSSIQAFVELSAGEYGVKIGGSKGNITFTSFDGRYKIVRQIAETLTFDERLQAAKALIDECINDWSTTSRPEIRVLINDAFSVNRQGAIDTGRVLGLKRLDIKDEKWQRAMTAIADSVQTANTKPYLRFYERIGDTDQYKSISLDIASA